MNTIINEEIQIPEFDKNVLKSLAKKFVNAKIYYKPFINGDVPDILVLEENKGVILIEISTIKLSEYTIKDKNTLVSKSTNDEILSPIKKLTNFKNNLFKSHIDGLLEQKVKSKGTAFNLIKNVVIFEYETDENIINYFGKNNIEFTRLLSKNNFDTIPLLQKSTFCNQKIYTSFLKVLTPTIHKKEDGEYLNYTKKQEELSVSKKGQFKIRGVAGAGKTYILAKRAINSHKRHLGTVLILTYNKSLKQYIVHKLNDVTEDFEHKFFHVDNYHNFIATVGNNLSLTSEANLEKMKDKFPKYKAIFIDEIQDYETNWIRIIKKYFLEEDGEFIVFGDEKQNVYDRELDQDKKINTTIPGRWNELKDSFRFNGIIVDLTNAFQEKFLSQKYEIAKIEKQNTLNFNNEQIEYIHFDKNSTLKELAYAIHLKINNDNLKLQDISIIGSRIKFLQDLDYILRNELKRPTQTIFETREYLKNYGNNKMAIDEIRNFKKNNFDIYADAIKLSTIPSFKGYEAETLFFIITEDDITDETIYTAFTRAKTNLYIINIGNRKYDEFFNKNIANTNNIQKKVTEEIEETITTLDQASDEAARLKLLVQDLQEQFRLQKEEVAKTNEENKKLQIDIEKALSETGQIEQTINYTKKIESLLENLGAEGKGIHTKLGSIKEKLEESLVKKIRWIGNMRNGLMHQDGFEIYNFNDFDKACKEVIRHLELLRLS
jgi:hypothetical protein